MGFREHYEQQWNRYAGWIPNWFDRLCDHNDSQNAKAGWTLIEIYPLKDAQVTELDRIFALPSQEVTR